MLITDHFVLLNLPKTGSTFSRTCLKKIYQRKFTRLPLSEKLAIVLRMKPPLIQEQLVPNIKVKINLGKKSTIDPHGTYRQIPSEHSHKKIISVCRNPIDGYLSRYDFEHWIKYPPCPLEVIRKRFPKFPDISFREYLELTDMAIPNFIGYEIKNAEIGLLSIQFVQMFFKDPDRVLANMTDDYIDSDQPLKDLADIQFLRQENLKQDLKSFLKDYEFPKEDLDQIDRLGLINVSRRKVPDRKTLLEPDLIEKIKRKERLTYKILELKGIDYLSPD